MTEAILRKFNIEDYNAALAKRPTYDHMFLLRRQQPCLEIVSAGYSNAGAIRLRPAAEEADAYLMDILGASVDTPISCFIPRAKFTEFAQKFTEFAASVTEYEAVVAALQAELEANTASSVHDEEDSFGKPLSAEASC
jgi:hypothetical protein